MRKLLAIGGSCCAILIAASIYFAPHITLYQMRSAIENKDADAFSTHVDFPALRDSFKGQMMAAMSKQMSSPAMKDNPFAAMGQAMAAAFIGPMIDNVISPAGVIAMMSEGSPKPVTAAANGVPIETASNETDKQNKPDFSLAYKSANKVIVTDKNVVRSDGAFIFTRNGIWDWKLSSVELPQNVLK